MSGEILTSVGTSTYFKDVQQPFKFVAADSVDTTDAKILIRAGVYESSGGGGGGSPDSFRDVSPTDKPDSLSMKKQESHAKLKDMKPNVSVRGASNPARPAWGETCNADAFQYELFGVGEAEIGKDTLDHFAIKLEHDTIAFTELSKLYVQAKNAKNEDIKLDGNTPLKLCVSTNEEYGTFINKNGDTLKTTPVVLENIPYEDAKTGLIRLAAVKKNPDSIVSCTIRAELQNDTTKKGEKDAIVVEQTLKIVMETPHEVRPSIPTEDRNQTMVNLRRKSFDVRMTRGGKPVVNHPFQLTTDYVRGSGGHDHGETRDTIRANNNDNYGYFYTDQDTTHRRPFDTLTNTEGRFTAIEYNASIFGDTMRIILKSRSNRLLVDSVSILERVFGLQLLGDGTNYIKAGGTCNHHGPRTDTSYTNCRTPDNNHWIMSAAAVSLEGAAEEFLHAEWNRNREQMRINDLSLPFGGLFDKDGDWRNPHTSHRTGNDVDIENRGRLLRLRQILEMRSWRYIQEGANFFPHFRFQ
jgi:hypothetical protein